MKLYGKKCGRYGIKSGTRTPCNILKISRSSNGTCCCHLQEHNTRYKCPFIFAAELVLIYEIEGSFLLPKVNKALQNYRPHISDDKYPSLSLQRKFISWELERFKNRFHLPGRIKKYHILKTFRKRSKY